MTHHDESAAALRACDFDASPKTVADVAAAMQGPDLATEVDRLLEEFGLIVEDASDKIVGMWAAARAIHTATGIDRAKAVANYLLPFCKLIVALETCNPVDTPVPPEVPARLGHLLRDGQQIPTTIPPPAIGPGETDFAAGVRLGISRARIFERKPVSGQLRRHRKK